MRRRRLIPKPEAPADGMFLIDQWTGDEVFVTFEDLRMMCIDSVRDGPCPTYRDDPTYHMKKQRKRL